MQAPTNDDPAARLPAHAVPVTRDEFFAMLNQVDVHPKPSGAYSDKRGYWTTWETPYRVVMGWSDGGEAYGSSRYWLAK